MVGAPPGPPVPVPRKESTSAGHHVREAHSLEWRCRCSVLDRPSTACRRCTAKTPQAPPPPSSSGRTLHPDYKFEVVLSRWGSRCCSLQPRCATFCVPVRQRGDLTSVAYAGWLVVVAGLSQMVMWSWGLINGAADAADDAALHSLSYVAYFGWAGMGIGLATAFIATGLGGIHSAVLPKWFGILTIVLGVLGALGDAGIPPGGLVDSCSITG